MGKQAKPKKDKVVKTRGEATPSVESEYQVSWLIDEIVVVDGVSKKTTGQWVDEETTRTSRGRKALTKSLKKPRPANLFRVRLAKKGSK